LLTLLFPCSFLFCLFTVMILISQRWILVFLCIDDG
jgi:hypothetical protein